MARINVIKPVMIISLQCIREWGNNKIKVGPLPWFKPRGVDVQSTKADKTRDDLC